MKELYKSYSGVFYNQEHASNGNEVDKGFLGLFDWNRSSRQGFQGNISDEQKELIMDVITKEESIPPVPVYGTREPWYMSALEITKLRLYITQVQALKIPPGDRKPRPGPSPLLKGGVTCLTSAIVPPPPARKRPHSAFSFTPGFTGDSNTVKRKCVEAVNKLLCGGT